MFPSLSVGVTALTASTATRDDLVRITLSGEIDASTADCVVTAVSDVLRSASPTEIALDLADVEFIDARGVTALMRVRTLATDVGCVLRFDDAQPLVARVLQITGLLP